MTKNAKKSNFVATRLAAEAKNAICHTIAMSETAVIIAAMWIVRRICVNYYESLADMTLSSQINE